MEKVCPMGRLFRLMFTFMIDSRGAFHERKPQTVALSCVECVAPIEFLKNVFSHLGTDAAAVIAHLDDGKHSLGFKRERHRAAVLRIFQRVGNKVVTATDSITVLSKLLTTHVLLW